MRTRYAVHCSAIAAVLAGSAMLAPNPPKSGKIQAQKIVEELAARHPEIEVLELAAQSKSPGCKTIAATETKEIGEKCDYDEFTAMKTDQAFVERKRLRCHHADPRPNRGNNWNGGHGLQV